MSYIEERVGTMYKISFPSYVEAWKEKIDYIKNNLADFDYQYQEEGYVEWYSIKRKEEIVFINSDFYHVIYSLRADDSGNIRKIENNNSSSIDFVLSYYNGGTCFEQIISEFIGEA